MTGRSAPQGADGGVHVRPAGHGQDAVAGAAWFALPAAVANWLTGLPVDVVALVAAGRLRLARPMVNGVAR